MRDELLPVSGIAMFRNAAKSMARSQDKYRVAWLVRLIRDGSDRLNYFVG